MSHPNLLSVVIATFNRSDALLSVLEGFSQQTDRGFELIVADDGSRVEHLQPILNSPVARALRVTHVWHPDVGFTLAKIRNRGVAASTGDYIIFLDGDCVPERDFIARHRALAEPGCFVSGSRVLLNEELSQKVVTNSETIVGRSVAYWVRQWLLGRANKFTGTLRLADWQLRKHKGDPWRGIRGCNMAVWKADYERIDGFDESFVGWGHEDADFVLRLHHAGLARKNGFCATEVYHLWHREAARASESRNAQVVRERMQTKAILPTSGYAQARPDDDAVITRL